MSRYSTFLDVFFCGLLAFIASISLWSLPGFPASWDFAAHLVSTAKVVYWLERGVYPLQFPEFFFGFPTLHFYSPLFFLVSAFLAIIFGLDPSSAVKVTLIVSFELTALITYHLCRKIFNSRQGAIVSSVGFTYAGFHIVNILSTGMYPAALAFVFLPAVFGYQYLSVRESRLSFSLYSGVALGLMILSHMLTAYVTAIFLVLFGVFQLLLNIRFPRIVLRTVVFLAVAVLSSLAIAGWFLIPYVECIYGTFMTNGVIEAFTKDPHVYAGRAVPIELFFMRYPPEYAATTGRMPFYIGTALTTLTFIGAVLLFRHPKSTRITNFKDSNQFAFLMALTLLFSISFCSYTKWIFIIPNFAAQYFFLTQFPGRAAFLPSFAAAVLAGYSVGRLSSSISFEKLADRLNLDFNPSVVMTLAICSLLILDSSIYFMDPSPYQYQATYPPYGSSGLELSWRWVSQQKGYFRVIDPIGGPYARVTVWDNLMGVWWYGDPSNTPFSENTLRTWKFILASDDSVDDMELKGYFGVKYGIGHLHDPRKEFEFTGTEWVPVAAFYEITVFENPHFRPVAEVVDDFDSPSSTQVGETEIVRFDASRIELVTKTSRSSFLVLKWFNSPDWRCLLDGSPIALSENQWGFMYVKLLPGDHLVKFTYGEVHMTFIHTYLVMLITLAALGAMYRYRKSIRLSIFDYRKRAMLESLSKHHKE